MIKNPSLEIIQNICKDRKVRTKITKNSHEWFFIVYFSHYITSPSAPFHEEFFKLTEDSTNKLLCIVAFRGSGKSTIFTTSYPLWAILGKQEKKFIIIACQTKNQAKQHMMNLRSELENNKLLKNDLGPFQEEHDNEWGSSSLVFSKTNARITVVSVEQSIRGLRHQQHRPDLIIADDIEDLSSTKTQEGRDKTYQWFTSEILPVGGPNTNIVVVGNLLHEDSLLMRLKHEIEINQRGGVFREYPLIDKNDNVLWSGKYPTLESIKEQKQIIGSESAWQREFLLRIITSDDQVVSPEWIKYYDIHPDDGYNSDFRFVATGIDLAISEKESADYTAMVSAKIFGRGNDLRVYILPNPINERLNFPKTVERVKNISLALGGGTYTKLYIEDVGYQRSLIQHLETQNIPVEEFKTQGQDKRTRLTLTTSLIQSGKILFPRSGADLLIRQLTGFGKERHDDLADAFAIVILKVMSADAQSFFPEWEKSKYVISPIEIPHRWLKYRSISFGLNGYVSCHWIAVDENEIAHIYKEYYETDKDHVRHAKAIFELSELTDDVQEEYQFTVLDDSAFEIGIGESAFQIYDKAGIANILRPNKNSEMKWDSIRYHLGADKNSELRLKVFNTVTHFARAIPLLIPNANNRKDVSKETDTSAVDGVGQLLRTRYGQGAPRSENPVQKKMRELGLNPMLGIASENL